MDKEMKKFWKRLEGYGNNYATLKRKIVGAYLKTLLENKLIVAQLVKLVKKSARDVIEDEKDLDTYYWKSWIVATNLVEANIINVRQYNKYFWKQLS